MIDLEKYKAREVKICCDDCGNVVDLAKTMKTRVIGKDPVGREVVEQYFTCDDCGRHYTIAVMDTKQRTLIRERQQLQRQIRIFAQIGAKDKKIRVMQRKEEHMKNELMKRSAQLKECWKEVCGNVPE